MPRRIWPFIRRTAHIVLIGSGVLFWIVTLALYLLDASQLASMELCLSWIRTPPVGRSTAEPKPEPRPGERRMYLRW